MITLTVIAFNDTPADGTLQARFDELGGSIGRAATNQLVLPDPERMVSRVAAQVVYRNGAFAIIDRGSNPILLNGQALASGREAPLATGDRVHICGYELSVTVEAARPAATDDPFAHLLGPAPATPPWGGALIDPLARRPGPTAAPVASRAAPATTSVASRPAPTAGGIPSDWDPFAPPASSAGGSAPSAPLQRDALGLDLGGAAPAALVPGMNTASAQNSLDQLFGLGPALGGDPLGSSVLDAPLAQPNMAADVDPLRSLNSAPQASAASEADQLSDLQRPFIPPTVIKPATPFAAAPLVGVANRAAPRETAAAPPAARGHPPATPEAPAAAASPASLQAAPSPFIAASRGIPAPAAGGDESAALLAAFRRGLQAPGVELPALTPEVMELIGELLREAVSGTVELLRARTTVKHELRAEVTTIVPKNNNPLKFSPNGEVALQHLLAPPARGFMAAAPAMSEAYEDLRTHQFALVAAMQAVLEAALQRFDPVALESRLGDRSLLHSLVPASRHARLWELFTEHYAHIRGDATDDFHAVFGHAFLAAYGEHVKRVQAQRGAPHPEA